MPARVCATLMRTGYTLFNDHAFNGYAFNDHDGLRGTIVAQLDDTEKAPETIGCA